MSLKCCIGWHCWSVQVRGFLHEGLVQPLRLRTCPKCHRTEREIFDPQSGAARWIPDTPRFSADVLISGPAEK